MSKLPAGSKQTIQNGVVATHIIQTVTAGCFYNRSEEGTP